MTKTKAGRSSSEARGPSMPVNAEPTKDEQNADVFFPPEFRGDPALEVSADSEGTPGLIVSTSPVESEKIAAPAQKRRKSPQPKVRSWLVKQWWFPLSLIFITSVLLVALFGLADRTDFFGVVKRAVTARGYATHLLTSRGEAVLMQETLSTARRVIVKQTGQASWLLVSQDDITADKPAITPAGDRVAYVSARDGGQIVAVSLKKDERIPITAADAAKAGKDASLNISHICPWTPVDWASTGERLAFFGCAPDNSVSFLMISDLTTTPAKTVAVAASQLLSPDERQVKWLDASRMIVSLPAADPQKAAVITEYAIP